MFRTALSLHGYDVLEAGDGLDALRILDGSVVHLIVLDLGLPLIPGKTVLQEVAAQARFRAVPLVIVVTGQAGPYDDLAEASCVLTKPVSPERLVLTVTRCLAISAASPSPIA
jgi:two-component system chemotaxis response regulator CheY